MKDGERMGIEPLEPAVDGLARTREALQSVAERLLAPSCKPDNEIALKATPGGFGTPPFEFEGSERQVRVDGADLVVSRNGEEKRAPLTTIGAGAELIGSDLLPGGAHDDGEPLAIDTAAAEQLGRWFALGDAALEQLREEWAADEPSAAYLWPEHFDIAIEAGADSSGERANYGFSPGDADHEQPYLYVGPWTAEVSGELWEAKGFNGAELAYSEIAAADDPLALVLEFCRARHDALASL
jgi:hypothetical protein